MSLRKALPVAAAVAVLGTSSLSPRSTGLLDFDVAAQPLVVRQQPSCGACHSSPSGSRPDLVVHLEPSKTSLSLGETLEITTRTTGGLPGTVGGFVTETTGGLFQPRGDDTHIKGVAYITNTQAGSRQRSWSYGLRVPQVTGPIELFTAALTGDGDGTTAGDVWGVHGARSGQLFTAPVRIFVNAPGTTEVGPGCSDRFGNVPVLGSDETVRLGNGDFHLNLIHAPTAAIGYLLVGSPGAEAVALDGIGMPGCSLYLGAVQQTLPFTTSTGTALLAEGVAQISLPLPDAPALAGLRVLAQAAILDAANPLGLISSNGVAIDL